MEGFGTERERKDFFPKTTSLGAAFQSSICYHITTSSIQSLSRFFFSQLLNFNVGPKYLSFFPLFTLQSFWLVIKSDRFIPTLYTQYKYIHSTGKVYTFSKGSDGWATPSYTQLLRTQTVNTVYTYKRLVLL